MQCQKNTNLLHILIPLSLQRSTMSVSIVLLVSKIYDTFTDKLHSWFFSLLICEFFFLFLDSWRYMLYNEKRKKGEGGNDVKEIEIVSGKCEP